MSRQLVLEGLLLVARGAARLMERCRRFNASNGELLLGTRLVDSRQRRVECRDVLGQWVRVQYLAGRGLIA